METRIRKLRVIVAVAAFTAGLSSCVEKLTFSPQAKTLIVEGVIDASSLHQDIFVQYTNGVARDQFYVADADVSITAPDGARLTADVTTDTVSEFVFPREVLTVRTFYRVSLNKYRHTIVPGGTYRLRVKVPNLPEVTASTTVPAVSAATFDTVVGTFNLLRDTLSLSWPETPGARMHQVAVSCSSGQRLAVFAQKSLLLSGLALYLHHQGDDASVFKPNDSCNVAVMAVDANYHNYFRFVSTPEGQPVLTGQLNGAVGVFGSIAPVSRRRFVVTIE